MQATDVKPTRLAAAQAAVRKFLEKVPKQRAGRTDRVRRRASGRRAADDRPRPRPGGPRQPRTASAGTAAPRSATRSPRRSSWSSRRSPGGRRRSPTHVADADEEEPGRRSSSSPTATRPAACCSRSRAPPGRRRRASRCTRSRSGRRTASSIAAVRRRTPRRHRRRFRRPAGASVTGGASRCRRTRPRCGRSPRRPAESSSRRAPRRRSQSAYENLGSLVGREPGKREVTSVVRGAGGDPARRRGAVLGVHRAAPAVGLSSSANPMLAGLRGVAREVVTAARTPRVAPKAAGRVCRQSLGAEEFLFSFRIFPPRLASP